MKCPCLGSNDLRLSSIILLTCRGTSLLRAEEYLLQQFRGMSMHFDALTQLDKDSILGRISSRQKSAIMNHLRGGCQLVCQVTAPQHLFTTYSRAACRRIYVSEDTSSVIFPILTIAFTHTLSIKDRS